MNLHNVEFVKSGATLEGLPPRTLPEIAFAGKSNVGKSSVINRILNRKNFARVGEAPGKTTHANYFIVDKKCYFVDLPGYGYAKVPKTEKERWGKLMEGYFASGRITLGILIVDARHAPTMNDITMADYFLQTGSPITQWQNILENRFIRIHRSYLVNGSFIRSYDNESVTVKEKILPISRMNREVIIKACQRYCI